jgi:hypothetical protein
MVLVLVIVGLAFYCVGIGAGYFPPVCSDIGEGGNFLKMMVSSSVG